MPCPILLALGFFICELEMPKEPELSFFQQLLAFASLAGLGGIANYLTTIKAGKSLNGRHFGLSLFAVRLLV